MARFVLNYVNLWGIPANPDYFKQLRLPPWSYSRSPPFNLGEFVAEHDTVLAEIALKSSFPELEQDAFKGLRDQLEELRNLKVYNIKKAHAILSRLKSVRGSVRLGWSV